MFHRFISAKDFRLVHVDILTAIENIAERNNCTSWHFIFSYMNMNSNPRNKMYRYCNIFRSVYGYEKSCFNVVTSSVEQVAGLEGTQFPFFLSIRSRKSNFTSVRAYAKIQQPLKMGLIKKNYHRKSNHACDIHGWGTSNSCLPGTVVGEGIVVPSIHFRCVWI